MDRRIVWVGVVLAATGQIAVFLLIGLLAVALRQSPRFVKWEIRRVIRWAKRRMTDGSVGPTGRYR